MTPLFADAFYYFALLNPDDEAHERAVQLTADFDGDLVTTAWVLTEVADGMADPANRGPFHRFYGIAEALTGDHHFEQAGYAALLKG